MDESLKILVVDDDPAVLFASSKVVESAGYTTLKASSGEECLALTREHQPDLILLDVVLPDADGRNLAQQIKANPLMGDPFIILLSGQMISSDDRIRGLEIGADGYILRPVSNQELKAELNSFVRIKKLQKALIKSESLFRTTIASIGDAVITTNVDRKVEFLNRVAEQLTGWASEEAKEKPIKEIFRIINNKTGEEVECPIESTLRLGRPVGLAEGTFLISKEGKKTPIIDSAAPIRNDNGKITGAVIVFRDFTEEALAKETILQDANMLEKRVSERTKELQNFAELTAGREVRMAGLKKTIKVLRKQLEDAGINPKANDPWLE